MAKSRGRKLADIIVTSGADIAGTLSFDGGSTSADLSFADSDKATFGDSLDLQIFHDGNNSRITDSGTGALILRGANSVEIEDVSGEDMAIFRSNGAVELYHNNSKKIETTSSGVSVTGAVTSTTGFITGANTRVQSSSGMLFLTGAAAIPFEVGVGSEKMRLTSTGLGIGTTSPTEPLTVSETSSGNTMQVASFVNPVGTANTGVRLWLSGTNTTTRGTFIDAVAESTANDHSLRFGTSANSSAPTERMRIDKSGNLGLGTTSPNSYTNYTALTINGTNGGLLDFETNGTFVGEVFADSTTGLALQSIGSRYIRFLTNSGERMRIAAAGNVGIGTTSPSTILDVTGNSFHIGDGSYEGFLGKGNYALTGGGANNLALRSASDLVFGTGGDNIRAIITSSGRVGIGHTSPNANVHINAGNNNSVTIGDATNPALQIGGTTNYRFGVYTDGETAYIENKNGDDGIAFRVKTAGEAMRIDGGTGKVIIADSASHTDDLFQIETPASGGGHGIQIRRNDANTDQQIGRILFGNNTDTDLAQIAAKTDGDSNAGDSGALFFSTQATSGSLTERLRISSTGNVGIGITNPAAKLNISSASDALLTLQNNIYQGSGQNTETILRFKSGAGTDDERAKGGILFKNDGSAFGRGDLHFLVDSTEDNGNAVLADSKMVITHEGRVGIGINNPVAPLVVQAQSNAIGINLVGRTSDSIGELNFTASNGTNQSSIQSRTTDLRVKTLQSIPLTFHTANTERMRITSNNPYLFLGDTGHSWNTFNAVLQIGRTGFIANYDGTGTSNQQTVIANNTYYSSGYTSIEAATGSVYMNLVAGDARFFTAPATTAGSAQTFTERLTLTTAGNLGIGATAPSRRLHVQSPGSVPCALFGNSANNNSIELTRTTSAAAYVALQAYSNIGILVGGPTLAFSTANSGGGSVTERMRITSSGNVGIGTTSPAHKLDVVGDIRLSGDLTYGTATNFDIKLPYESQNITFHTTAAGAATAEKMRIRHDGKVGIGTTSPTETLDVDGNIKFSGSIVDSNNEQIQFSLNDIVAFSKHIRAEFGLWARGATARAMGIDGSGTYMGLYTNTTEKVRIDTNGNVGIGTTSPNRKLEVDFTGSVYGARFTRSDSAGNSLIEFANNQGVKNVTGFDSGNSGYVISTGSTVHLLVKNSTGNVGIGETNPLSPLVIKRTENTAFNAADTSGQDQNGATLAIQNLSDTNNTFSQLLLRNRNSSKAVSRIASLTNGTGTDLVFVVENQGSNPGEVMRINKAGNIGIGTTSPTTKLDVAGGVGASSTSGSNAAYSLGWQNSARALEMRYDSTYYMGIEMHAQTRDLIFNNKSGDNAGDIRFFTGSTLTEKFTILAGGNVGIGESIPTEKLHVGGNIKMQATTAIVTYQNAANTWNIGLDAADASFKFKDGTAERIRIDSSGNFLVNATSQQGKVTIRTTNSTGLHIRQTSTSVNYLPAIIRNDYITGGQTGKLIRFERGDGAEVGSVTSALSAVSYNTSSDQRLKDNIVEAPSASDDIDAIQVRSFDWKVDGSHQKYGMVAQELQNVAPGAVTAPENPEEMMGVDYSKLVPMLVKEIQSLRARVAELEGE